MSGPADAPPTPRCGEPAPEAGGFDLTTPEGAARVTRYFAEHWPLLRALAHRLAGPSVDPDDLLAEAVFATVRRWREGSGPQRHVTQYVVAAMRNRIKDELKSPRSRTEPIDDLGLPASSRATDRAELLIEFDLVRRAFLELPEDHRAVLAATIIDGRRPRELQDELARSPAAISALAQRAKLNLRRRMLRLLLKQSAAFPACAAAVDSLPADVAAGPPDPHPRAGHYADCERCRELWREFDRMGGEAAAGWQSGP